VVFGGPDKAGVAPLEVLDSFRLQATRKTAQVTNERTALRARVFDVDMLGSNGLGESILHDSAESVGRTSARRFKVVQDLRRVAGLPRIGGVNGLQRNLWENEEHPLTLKERAYPERDILRSPNGPGRPSCSAQNKRGERDCLSARRVCRRLGTS
jgi:hypothetical protein